MRKLIHFLISNVFYLIFLVLVALSGLLIFNFNDFQKSIFLNSANGLVGNLHNIANTTTEYFGLKEKNENLSEENAALWNRIFLLESQLESIDDTLKTDTVIVSPEKSYHFFSAKVINNSTNKSRNYITLNKGALDGVRPDMGVVSDQGIVGIVSSVSDHFSVVISVLNPIVMFSSKLKKTNYAGYTIWDGKDYRYVKLDDIPEHVSVAVGDTVVTTGYTDGFPQDIPIGVVESFDKQPGNPYFDINVELFTDFKVLSHVKVIDYYYREEQTELEESTHQ